MTTVLMLNEGPTGVSAYMAEKSHGIETLVRQHGADALFAYYGDDRNDLPALLHENTALPACPPDATYCVIQTVKSIGGIVTENPLLAGFYEVYARAWARGLTAVITDRDGSIVRQGDYSSGADFHKLARGMGRGGKPWIYFLTGAGAEQNLALIKGLNLHRIGGKTRKNPYLVMAENGLTRVNIYDPSDVIDNIGGIDPDTFNKMPGFRQTVLELLQPVLQKYGFSLATDEKKQDSQVGYPNKKGGASIDLPRNVGGQDYRGTEAAWQFKAELLEVMICAAEMNNLPWAMA